MSLPTKTWHERVLKVKTEIKPTGKLIFTTPEYQFLYEPNLVRFFRWNVFDYTDWEEWKVVDGKVCSWQYLWTAPEKGWVPLPEEAQEAYQQHLARIVTEATDERS